MFQFCSDFRALQAQDTNLDRCISTWVPKFVTLFLHVCIHNLSILRTQSIQDIVCKIKFPHGLYNTVAELVSATNFPSTESDWSTAIGRAPSKEEIEESAIIFERENYPNMYR